MGWKQLGALLVLTTGCRHAAPSHVGGQPAAGELAQIARWEDARSLGAGALERTAISGPQPALRVRALRALARLQAPATAGTLIQALGDADPSVREEAAFAAGSLGLSWEPIPDAARDALTDALLTKEAGEEVNTVRVAQLDALGRLGAPRGLEALVNRMSLEDEALAARAALAWGVAAKRAGVSSAAVVPTLQSRLEKAKGAELVYALTYALAQSRAAAARAPLLSVLAHPDAEVRAVAVKGLGEVGQPTDAVALGKRLEDASVPVSAEAARTLAKLAYKCRSAGCSPLSTLEALKKVDPSRLQAFLALAQQPVPVSARPLLTQLRDALVSPTAAAVGAVRLDLAWMDCRLAASLDRLEGRLRQVFTCGDGAVPEGRRLALGLKEVASSPPAQPQSRAWEALGFLHHPSPHVRAAALEVVGATKWADASAQVRKSLDDEDPVVVVTAAKAAGQLGDRAAIPRLRELMSAGVGLPDAAPLLAAALVGLSAKEAVPELRAWLQSSHPLVRASAAAALSSLTGEVVAAPWVERASNASPVSPAPESARLRVVTAKGTLVLQLDTESAPVTTASLWSLARKGFFDGLTFHRVVPNFVAQGGDPRGDGEGGPGYAVRCELSPRRYRRGTVGMALSGKDTGGSQFFIAASAQPHLEGRYSVVGEVTEGAELLDVLMEGEEIEKVEALP